MSRCNRIHRSVLLRRYGPADEPHVAALLNLAAADLRALPWLIFDNDDFAPKPPDFVSRRLSRGLLELEGTFVACRDGTMVGTAACWCSPEDGIAFLQWLTVHPDYRGQGIGSALLARCEQHARERGCAELQTERWIDSRAAGICWLLSGCGYRLARPRQMNVTMLAALRRSRPAESRAVHGLRIVPLSLAHVGEWVDVKNAIFGSSNRTDWFLRNYVEQPNFCAEGWFFAEYGGRKVGIAGAVIHVCPWSDELKGSIEWVGALPDARGKGVGRALTHACMKFLFERGLEEACLLTQYFREPAVALYRQLGFRVVREHRLYAKTLR